MKYLIIIVSFSLFFSCNTENNKTGNTLNKFIDNFFLSEDFNIDKINEYMVLDYVQKYNSLSDKKKQIHNDYIKSNISQIRKVLESNNSTYEIIKKEDINSKDYSKEVVYNGNGDIFAFKVGGEILMFFIIEENKLYSFCTDVYLSSSRKIVPYFFFDEDKIYKR